MISNFRRVLNVAFFLFGDSPASEFHMPTFRYTVPSFLLTSLMRMEQSVPKRRNIKFRPWGIIQKKEYNNDDDDDDDTIALTVSSRLPLDSGCK